MKKEKILKIIIAILLILILLGVGLTEVIGNYFVNYAIARSGAGGDRKISQERTIEVLGEDEKIIENNKKIAKENSEKWSEAIQQKQVEVKARFNLPEFPVLNMFQIVANRKAKYDIKEASSLEQVKKSKTPILFIHGDKDDFVPEYMCEKLYDATNCKKEKIIIHGAGHTDGKYREPEKYYNTIFDWISR